MYAQCPVARFIKELSSDKPYPGGGSATCLVGALALALSQMVAAILSNRKRNHSDRKRRAVLARLIREFDRMSTKALASIDGDIQVYKRIVQAYSLSRKNPRRTQIIDEALKGGFGFQENFARLLICAQKTQASLQLYAEGSIASDLVLSRHFLAASFQGALQTARVNLMCMNNGRFRQKGGALLSRLTREFRMARGK